MGMAVQFNTSMYTCEEYICYQMSTTKESRINMRTFIQKYMTTVRLYT